MLCTGTDAVFGMDALPDRTAMQLKSGSALMWEHVVPPRWDAVTSANATSSPHVQAGKPALSLPWASRHPSEPGTSVQGGERPLTHPPHCESAAGLGQEPQPDILPSLCSLSHAPSRMDPVLPGQKWAGKRVWEEGTEPQQQLCMAGAGIAAHHPVLPQELMGRKARVGWGLLCQSLPLAPSLTEPREEAGWRLRLHVRPPSRAPAGRSPGSAHGASSPVHGSQMGRKFL